MADYTNRAIMKKLEAITNLVNVTEESYRRFAETDEKIRNATARYMSVRLICCISSWKINSKQKKMNIFIFISYYFLLATWLLELKECY